MKGLSIFLTILMAITSGDQKAESHGDRRVAELFKESDLVIEGRLVSGTLQCFNHLESCRNYYEVQPEKLRKGNLARGNGPLPSIRILANKSLTGEMTYVFFLHRAEPGECDCVYMAPIDGVFQRVPDGRVLRHTSVDSFKPVSIEGRQLWTFLVAEPFFDRELAAAESRQKEGH